MLIAVFTISIFFIQLWSSAYSQDIGRSEKNAARIMLKTVKDNIKKFFYDPNFRGADIEELFREAENRIAQAQSQAQLNSIIGQFLLALNEPNTLFVSPTSLRMIDYGWDWLMIGDSCHVISVKSGSDAEAKGMKIGDEVLSISGYKPTRVDAWKIKYTLSFVRPQSILEVIIRGAKNEPRQLDIRSKAILSGSRVNDLDLHQIERKFDKELASEKIEIADSLMIWKLFSISDNEQIDNALKRARKYKSLIIDLRSCSESISGDGDSSYSTKKLQEIIGYIFDKDIKIADIKNRKEREPLLAKTRNDQAFTGKIAVLINSETSSIAEIFTRVIQLEKRGLIVGDKSQGAARLSSWWTHVIGAEEFAIPYAVKVTDREVILSDGRSVDGIGVTPDVMVVPTAADIAGKNDPVLSRAANLLGVEMSPAEAGTLLKHRNYTLWMK